MRWFHSLKAKLIAMALLGMAVVALQIYAYNDLNRYYTQKSLQQAWQLGHEKFTALQHLLAHLGKSDSFIVSIQQSILLHKPDALKKADHQLHQIALSIEIFADLQGLSESEQRDLQQLKTMVADYQKVIGQVTTLLHDRSLSAKTIAAQVQIDDQPTIAAIDHLSNVAFIHLNRLHDAMIKAGLFDKTDFLHLIHLQVSQNLLYRNIGFTGIEQHLYNVLLRQDTPSLQRYDQSIEKIAEAVGNLQAIEGMPDAVEKLVLLKRHYQAQCNGLIAHLAQGENPASITQWLIETGSHNDLDLSLVMTRIKDGLAKEYLYLMPQGYAAEQRLFASLLWLLLCSMVILVCYIILMFYMALRFFPRRMQGIVTLVEHYKNRRLPPPTFFRDEFGYLQRILRGYEDERQMKERQLLQQRVERHDLLQAIHDSVLMVNYAGEIGDVSQKACQLLGYKRAAMATGKKLSQFIPSIHQSAPSLETLLTTQAAAMQALFVEDRHNFYNHAYLAHVPLLLVNSQGEIEHFNQRAEALFGYRESDVVGKSIEMLIPQSAQQQHRSHREHWQHARGDQKNFTLMAERAGLQALRCDESMVDVEIALMPMQGEGDERWTLAVIHPLDTRFAMLQGLSNANNAIDAILYQGHLDETVHGMELIDIDKKRLWVEVSDYLLNDETGLPTQVIVVIHNLEPLMQILREKNRVKNELLKVQNEKLQSIGMLASGIAHDFNNLLTPIIGNLEMMQQAQADDNPEIQWQCVEQSLTSARQAASLSKKMLSYSDSERLSSKTINLSHLIDGMKNSLNSLIAHQVPLMFDLPSTALQVDVDPVEIKQLIEALVFNGMEASQSSHQPIAVRCCVMQVNDEELAASRCTKSDATVGLYHAIEVEDGGTGMDGETLAKIFDPFYSTKAVGRGLSLAVVESIVRRHHGLIQIESELGKGTKIRIALPAIAQEQPASERTATVAQPQQPLSFSKHVLIVEDDELVAMVLEARLAQLGCTAEIAINGKLGAEAYAANHAQIDLVILDMEMPVMKGDACYQELVAINDAVRVIISSGYSSQKFLDEHGDLNFTGWFLEKPYEMAQLQEALQIAFSAKDDEKQVGR
ncbi:MAG: PAS domain-containing protein [Zetaproteobacteria bacterium]|nr:PAS domain-containing protein [Zetaproteobacteria bacterium]